MESAALAIPELSTKAQTSDSDSMEDSVEDVAVDQGRKEDALNGANTEGSSSSTTPKTSNDQPKTITDLPAELVLEILRYVIGRDARVDVPSDLKAIESSKLPSEGAEHEKVSSVNGSASHTVVKKKGAKERQGPDISALFTCKQLYYAGLNILYGENQLVFQDYESVDAFFRLISPRSAKLIKQVAFRLNCQVYMSRKAHGWTWRFRPELKPANLVIMHFLPRLESINICVAVQKQRSICWLGQTGPIVPEKVREGMEKEVKGHFKGIEAEKVIERIYVSEMKLVLD